MAEVDSNQIVPYWINADNISLKLSFSGGKASQ